VFVLAGIAGGGAALPRRCAPRAPEPVGRRRDAGRGMVPRVRVLVRVRRRCGHFEPLAPIARALEAAATASPSRPIPLMVRWSSGGLRGGRDGGDGRRAAGRKRCSRVSMEREYLALRERFAGRAGAAPRRSSRSAPAGGPDVLVRDEADFGAAVAADRLGLPLATVLVLASGGLLRPAGSGRGRSTPAGGAPRPAA